MTGLSSFLLLFKMLDFGSAEKSSLLPSYYVLLLLKYMITENRLVRLCVRF